MSPNFPNSKTCNPTNSRALMKLHHKKHEVNKLHVGLSSQNCPKNSDKEEEPHSPEIEDMYRVIKVESDMSFVFF